MDAVFLLTRESDAKLFFKFNIKKLKLKEE